MQDQDHDHSTHSHVHADGTPCSCETSAAAAEGDTAIDPVCGMTVTKDGAQHTASYQDRTYYFCSAHCRAKFLSNPVAYAAA